AQAQLRPEAVALSFAGAQVSYGELRERAERVGQALRQLGVGPEVLVGLSMERGVELVVGLLGILKAGGAYVPLDASYPEERLSYMLEDAAVRVLVVDAATRAKLSLASKLRVVTLDEVCELCDEQQPHAGTRQHDAGSDNLAYVIYTSGSTGTPKGIAVTHRGVVNNIIDLNRQFAVSAGDRVLALSSPSFDMSVYETLGMLGTGGTVIIPEPERAKDVAYWAELIREHQVTIWNSAPALLKALVEYVTPRPELWPRSLRLALLGGDWIPVTLADQLRSLDCEIEFISLGGVTEASIHSMIYPVEATDPTWRSIPYGRPMRNQEAYVLDSSLQPVPVGVSGEIHYGGVGLARGYFNRPALTAERFIPHPFSRQPGARLYKTSDLARFHPDGQLELLGRMDFQVKIRGLRVELEEIAAVLRRFPSIREAVVMMREDQPGNQRLVAYLVAEQHSTPDVQELQEHTKASLPDYMIPAVFVLMDRLPLSPNGKVDRRALPAPSPERPKLKEAPVLPRTPVEEVIAGLWSELLGVEQVGVHDDFLKLGGHSLLMTQLASRLQEAFLIELPLRLLLAAPTVALMSRELEALGQAGGKDVTKIARLYLRISRLSDAEVTAMSSANLN
ncbi:MAG TPA: non-ribosomal peptide synthetase, partial [Pyrinomonadaceae bacterium]